MILPSCGLDQAGPGPSRAEVVEYAHEATLKDLTHLPTAAEYRRAFGAIRARLTKNQLRMLEYHLRRRNPVTATELADHVGYKDWRGVNAQYGRVGMLLRQNSAALTGVGGQASHAFASFDKIPRKGGGYTEWIWVLHDPAREALNVLGWFPAK